MQRSYMLVAMLCLYMCACAQTNTKAPILLGTVQQQDLEATPYNAWFTTNYKSYIPTDQVITALQKLDMKNIKMELYLGTWCGDSKRETPRMLKVLNSISFPLKNVSIITVGDRDSLYKQSPEHQEAGKGIFKVPVLIVYKNGQEVNRINESPVLSIEKDLYAMFAGQSYQPNYRSFSLINTWINDGSLLDKNSHVTGMASLVKALVATEHELNGIGYLLLQQGKKQEAVTVFRINANLYPTSANILSSLGEGYYETGDHAKAVTCLESALAVNKEPSLQKEILRILYLAKGVH